MRNVLTALVCSVLCPTFPSGRLRWCFMQSFLKSISNQQSINTFHMERTGCRSPLEIVPESKMCASRSLRDTMWSFFLGFCGVSGWFVYWQSKLPLQGIDCNHSLRRGVVADVPDAFRSKHFKTALGFQKKARGIEPLASYTKQSGKHFTSITKMTTSVNSCQRLSISWQAPRFTGEPREMRHSFSLLKIL